MFETIFWGAVLRFGESLLQAAPTILVGFFVAGIIRRFLGYELTYRLFGGNSRRGLIQAWLIGMTLPICSLGAIPVIRELRRTGLPGGTILAFALAGPLFNPLSLLYGLTLSEPKTILGFALCSLAVVTVVGFLWDRFFPATARPEPAPPPVPQGPKRLASLVVFAAREICGVGSLYILVGLSGVILLAVVLPPGSLQHSMGNDNPYAPLVMTAVALPAYTTPMLAMSQLGMMFQHGNSVGAAFVLLAFGAGMNFGTLAWMWRTYGPRPSLTWLGLLMCVVIGLSYGVERPLRPADAPAADHTHAFDVYCQPFVAGEAAPFQRSLERLRQNRGLHEVAGIAVLGALLAAGIALRAFDPRRRVDSWLERPADASIGGTRGFDIVVPNGVVGGFIVLGIVAFSVVGCCAFYPPPSEVFEEMRIVKGEALGAAISGEREHAEQWLAVWDDWTRKLQVGVYLRRGSLSQYHRMKARVLREKLELLEHEVAEGDREEISKVTADISLAYRRLQHAYLEEL
jgi:uncharacterized membrane protein YraQ (UPF0718 family)